MAEYSSFQGRMLVQGTLQQSSSSSSSSSNSSTTKPLLVSDTGLSFWGGVDPHTATVVDPHHPLHGQCVTDTILCLPTGRGSCTASQVVWQLIRDGRAPAAVVLRQNDPLVTVGALVAEHVFGNDTMYQIPTMVCLGDEQYENLLSLAANATTGLVGTISPSTGALVVAACEEAILSLLPLDHHAPPPNLTSTIMNDNGNTLTPFEQERLAQANSDAERLALQVLFHYARICMVDDDNMDDRGKDNKELPTYVPVSRAHIDACTYIGTGSLALVQRFVDLDGRVVIPTTTNSQSTDRRQWQHLGVPAQYAANANALGDAYLQLGCQPTFTCAPYLLLNNDNDYQGQDWVWGESNAVVYANSVLGARTNKTGDYMDLCGALTGIMPRTGMHVPEQRVPTILLDATRTTDSWERSLLFALLGHACGALSDGHVPLVLGLHDLTPQPTSDELKTFCAAFGTTGSSPLIHLAHVTPEARNVDQVEDWTRQLRHHATKVVTDEFLQETYQKLNGMHHDDNDATTENSTTTTTEQPIDLIALGNPHLSVSECQTLAALVQAQPTHKKSPHVRIMACLSRDIQQQADQAGYLEPLQAFGVEFINDTCWCMLLDPPVVPARKDATILTNSGKYAHYGPGLTQRNVRLGSTADCLATARTGVFRPRRCYSTAAAMGLWRSLSKRIR